MPTLRAAGEGGAEATGGPSQQQVLGTTTGAQTTYAGLRRTGAVIHVPPQKWHATFNFSTTITHKDPGKIKGAASVLELPADLIFL